jgi:hypothetical protein
VTRRRRIAAFAAGGLVLWFVLLLVLGPIFAGHTRDRIVTRLGDSLQASSVSIGDADLGLVRGRLTLDHLLAKRDDVIGHLSLDVTSVRCELLPLGGALIDRDCRELAIAGLRLEVSTAALFKLKRPKRPPIHAAHVVIDDARFVFSPSAFAPGLGKIEVAIAHAEAGSTVFKTPLSWLFTLRVLDATLDLPGGISLHVDYRDGTLRTGGSAIPIPLPVADLADDARGEISKLVAFGKDVAERVASQRAEDWWKSLW